MFIAALESMLRRSRDIILIILYAHVCCEITACSTVSVIHEKFFVIEPKQRG